MVLRLLDTFAGIGGFSYAAERLVGGFETVAFVEREPFCQRVLSKHWPELPIHDDITTFEPLPGMADVITGGFPCQDISKAGLGAGITEGTRSGLFFDLMRVVRAVGPRYVVLENVGAIRKHWLGLVVAELASAGFSCEWACFQASDLGACHRRDRWWLVAHTHEVDTQGCWPEGQPIKPAPSQAGRALWSDQGSSRLNPDWRTYASQPLLRRGDDGLSGRVDRLKALGNAIVPHAAQPALLRVLELERLPFPPPLGNLEPR